MADFSRFGKPSKEWQEHVKKYGEAPEMPIGKMTAAAIQKSVNTGREEVSAQQMKDEGLMSKVDISTVQIHARDNFGIPTRIYKRKITDFSNEKNLFLPICVFFHGGGFVFGNLDSEDATCSRIVAAMDVIIFHVSYRHTPQHPFPDAHNDALDAFDWIMENAGTFGGDLGNVVVSGISAGANLACHVVMARQAALARDYENNGGAIIKGLILAIPWLIVNKDKVPYEEFSTKEVVSRVQCAEAPVIPSKVLSFFVESMGEDIRGNNEVNPDVGLVNGKKLSGLPSTTIVVAGNDPLRDDGLLFAQHLHQKRVGFSFDYPCVNNEKISANDHRVPVKAHVFPGLPHGFRRFNDLPSSRRWDELMIESIKWSLSKSTKKTSQKLLLTVEEKNTQAKV